MIPANFRYERPPNLDDALRLLAQHGDDAKILAGGHSLIPAMKLGLAEPVILVDLGRIPDLRHIRSRDGGFAIGAMTSHYEIESSALLKDGCPLLTQVAARIGDVQVRNKGTIGGSLAHADPAADWPAAILALDAELEIAAPGGRRTVRAQDFFVDLFETALQPGEILCEIRVPATSRSVAYVKTSQKASGFALASSAVVLDGGSARIGISGVGPKAYRAAAVESAIQGQPLTRDAIQTAAQHAADGIEPLEDIHASAEYRAHLARVNTARALAMAARAVRPKPAI